MSAARAPKAHRQSWFEATARQRIAAIADPGSFTEFLGPRERVQSPHLALFDLPAAFDDGIVVGAARVGRRQVFVAAQEGQFMGGSFGEVHGAKLTGLLQAAAAKKRDVVICFDTGGVRLQEANAGETAIAELIWALVAARRAGCRVVGLVGGRAGCFGGGGLILGCCSSIVISEQGRIGVSGPEVIETNVGVEEFDAQDRALVWRTVGGKHRYLIAGADLYVDDDVQAFRLAAVAALKRSGVLDAKGLAREQKRLAARIARFGTCHDGIDVWKKLGIREAAGVPEWSTASFLAAANKHREQADEAR